MVRQKVEREKQSVERKESEEGKGD